MSDYARCQYTRLLIGNLRSLCSVRLYAKVIVYLVCLMLLGVITAGCRVDSAHTKVGNMALITPPNVSQASPHWLPEGNRIIINSTDGWAVVNANDGDPLINLSEADNTIHLIDIAQNGKVALLGRLNSIPFGFQDLYIVNLDNVQRTDLLEISLAWRAALSPDGMRLAYATDDGLYLLEGENYKNSVELYYEPRTHAQQQRRVQYLAWSPDGQSIAYTTYDELRVVEVNTKGVVTIYSYPEPLPTDKVTGQIKQTIFSPAWSPDSQKILFSAQSRAFLYDLSQRNLQTIPSEYIGASWSNNGLVLSNRCTSLSILDPTDMSMIPISVNVPNYNGPLECTWFLDGTQVLIRTMASREGNITSADYYLLKVDKQQLIRLTDGSYVKDQADWSPNGRYIAFTGYQFDSLASQVYILELP
jgi:WD40 repeat protein